MAINATKVEYSQLVSRYKQLRKITRKLHNSILPEYLSKKTYNICGEKLGMLRNNTFVFANMDQTSVLMDYCIYDYREEGINAISRYMTDLTVAIIRICLARDSSDHIEYEDVGIEPATSPLRRETRVGRNDPCPCGNGRKYKRCCGR